MLKDSIKVTFLVLIFKIIGFVKQIIVANYFGTSSEMDMYSLAHSIVNQPAAIIAETLMLIIVTQFPRIKNRTGDEGAEKYISAVVSIVIIIFSVMALLIIMSSGIVSNMIVGEKPFLDYSTFKLFIIFEAPYIVFITIAHVLNSILEVQKKFVLPRVESFVNSVVVIAFVIVFSEMLGGFSLIFADIVSVISYLLLAILAINKIYKIRLINPFKNSDIKETILLMLPLILGNATYRINEIIDSYLASSVPGGASALSYSHVLEQLVTVTLGTAMVNVMYSYTSTYHAKGQRKLVEESVLNIIKVLLIILLPVSAIAVLGGDEIVSVLFMRGKFDIEAMHLTAEAFIGYAVAFVFVLIKSVFDKILILYDNARLISIIGIVSLITNVILSILLLHVVGLMGIPLATSLVTTIVTIYIAIYINIKYMKLFTKKTVKCISKIFLAFVIGMIVYCSIKTNFSNVFLNLCFKSFVCTIVYLIVLLLLRVIKIDYVYRMIKKRT